VKKPGEDRRLCEREAIVRRPARLPRAQVAGVHEHLELLRRAVPAADRQRAGRQRGHRRVGDDVEHVLEPLRARHRGRDAHERLPLALGVGARVVTPGERRAQGHGGAAGRGTSAPVVGRGPIQVHDCGWYRPDTLSA